MREKNPAFPEPILKQETVKKVSLGTVLTSATAESKVLHLASKYAERNGRLPRAYSNLSLSEMRTILQDRDPSLLEEKPGMTDAELEAARLLETDEAIQRQKENLAIVHNSEELMNPLGEIDDATLILVADEHKAPSYAVEGTRSAAFGGYWLERAILGAPEILDQRKRFQNIPRMMHAENNPDEPIPPLNLERRLIDRTDSRQLYDSWLTEFIADERFREDDQDESQPILFSLGDRVTDGAFLLDQFRGTGEYYSMMEEVKYRNEQLRLRFLQLNGNHDQDSRTPESIAMLTELFGHNMFAQELGGVMMVGIDTNIENPVWIEKFLLHADEDGKKVLAEKQGLQEMLIEILQLYPNPILLVGHHPSRVVEALGVKRDVLQNSNVEQIIGGHTHIEAHWETPILNKTGKPINMHILESISRNKNGKLQPPKAYTLRLHDGKIGPIRTIHESQQDLDKRYEELRMAREM